MHPSLAYLGVLTGTFLEGELTLISAAIAVHMGHIQMPGVILMAILGVQLTDWFHFLLGRYVGKKFLEGRPKTARKIKRVNRWIDRYPYRVLLSYRFMYGFRTVLPVAIGLSSISLSRFAVFSLLSAVLWACIYTALGYFLGSYILPHFQYLEHHSLEILLGLVGVAAIVALIRMIHLRRRLYRLRNRHQRNANS